MYFLALEKMAIKPVATMKTEGALWFPDLTVADPLMILPTVCALATLTVFEIGIETGVGAQQMQPGIRWFMRIVPFAFVVLFANKFPAVSIVSNLHCGMQWPADFSLDP